MKGSVCTMWAGANDSLAREFAPARWDAVERIWHYSSHFFTETGSYFRLIDSCITQLKAQGPSRTCNESKEEEEDIRQSSPDSSLGLQVRSHVERR